MIAAFAFLIGTGYILYYSGSDVLRGASSLAHWITGIVAPAVLIKHAFLRSRRRAVSRAAPIGAAAQAQPLS